MDNNNIKLFTDDGSCVSMPNIKQSEIDKNASLMSDSINEAIMGETVEQLIIPETSVINPENYIFDFSDTPSISVFQKEVLKSLVVQRDRGMDVGVEEGEEEGLSVSLYLYKTNGLVEFGKGDRYFLEGIIPLIRQHVFNNEIKIYKNYKIGDTAVKLVESRNITRMKLNL